MPIILLPLAVLLLAGYGVYAIITATLNPKAFLVVGAEIGAAVLVFHLLWVLIGRLGKK